MSAATKRGAKTLLQLYPELKKGIEVARRDILGHVVQTHPIRSGHKHNTTQLQATYWTQYYQKSINQVAKKVNPGFLFEEEERRQIKLSQLRRRGKGPPKKGSGKKKKK